MNNFLKICFLSYVSVSSLCALHSFDVDSPEANAHYNQWAAEILSQNVAVQGDLQVRPASEDLDVWAHLFLEPTESDASSFEPTPLGCDTGGQVSYPSSPSSSVSEEDQSSDRQPKPTITEEAKLIQQNNLLREATSSLSGEGFTFEQFVMSQPQILSAIENNVQGVARLDSSPLKDGLSLSYILLLHEQLKALKLCVLRTSPIEFDKLSSCLINLWGTFSRCCFIWELHGYQSETVDFCKELSEYGYSFIQ